MRVHTFIFVLAFLALRPLAADAHLPVRVPEPPQPFPRIQTQTVNSEFVAPGVTFYEYAFFTKDGPVVIHGVGIDPREPALRLDTVLAGDTLASGGETLSSMAARTGAVAGVNADYFDIGNTNAPLGLVVRNGQIIHTPNAHSGFALTRTGTILMQPFTFTGTVTIGTIALPLDGINEWPPRRGASLMTPAYGALPVADGISVAPLTPLDTNGTGIARYRIGELQAANHRIPRGYALALSAAAMETLGTPQSGDVVTVTETTEPALSNFIAAAGGGPLLVQHGARYFESDAPAAAEGRSRIPISAAAVAADGHLLLLEVDGRQPLHSIGLTREEFTSFLLAIHVREAVSFDGGGSSAIVTRRPGDKNATLRNEPSDGRERPVGDGLLVYSDAPLGPPARLAVRPNVLHALTGARMIVTTVVTDAAGHPLSAPLPQIVEAGTRARDTVVRFNRDGIAAELPVHVVDRAERIVVHPARANVHEAGEAIDFNVSAYDRDGNVLALPAQLPWAASAGTITPSGHYVAAAQSAQVEVRIGDRIARENVSVGEHEAELQLGTQWRFSSTPANGPGGLNFGEPCPVCIELQYDFTETERGATMLGDRPLPADAIGLRLDVNGDGNGEVLRVSVVNAINERVFLTAGRVTWTGWKTVDVRFPASLALPGKLRSIYVLNALNSPPVHASGSIAIRNARILLAGK